jgi:hypothetical protein
VRWRRRGNGETGCVTATDADAVLDSKRRHTPRHARLRPCATPLSRGDSLMWDGGGSGAGALPVLIRGVEGGSGAALPSPLLRGVAPRCAGAGAGAATGRRGVLLLLTQTLYLTPSDASHPSGEGTWR